MAPVSVADVAAVAAVALTEDGHEGKTYAPTGPDALSFAELTDIVSASAGRQVRYRPVTPGEFRSTALGAGATVHVVDTYAAMYDGIRGGWAAQPTDDVLHVTGRAPIAFADTRVAQQKPGAQTSDNRTPWPRQGTNSRLDD